MTAPPISGLHQRQPLAQPATSPVSAQAQKSATDFEAVFLSTMLKPIFENLSEDATLGGGSAETMWSGMLADTYASEMAKDGGVGIAESVYRDLLALQEGDRA